MDRAQTNLGLAVCRANTVTREIALVVAGAAITALCAQVSIPWQPVPVTLQTFAVLLCGVALGPRVGPLSQILYLGVGVCGGHVFAGAAFGTSALFGATGGYLLSFPFAALLLGWLSARGWDRRAWSLLLAMATAQALILACGTAWLSFFVGGIQSAWKLGAAPFLPIEAAKALILVLTIPGAWWLLQPDTRKRVTDDAGHL